MPSNDDKSKSYVSALQEEVARLEADKKAIASEFDKVAQEEWTPELIREKIRTELLPTAWLSLRELIMNAESEGVRASLIKWAFERASLPLENHAADPDKAFTALLKEIAQK